MTTRQPSRRTPEPPAYRLSRRPDVPRTPPAPQRRGHSQHTSRRCRGSRSCFHPQYVAEPDEPRRSPDRWMPPSAPQIRKAGPPNQAAPTRHSRHRRLTMDQACLGRRGANTLLAGGDLLPSGRAFGVGLWAPSTALLLSGDSARRLPKIGPGCCAAEIRPDLLLRRGRIASMAKRATILKVSGLRRAFGPNTIFDKFNLEVRTGEAIALTGRN